jgi:prepilin-type processing-associated H-X9-DG protein
VDNNGVLFLNSKIRHSDILDGSSQTILLGESIPAYADLGWASGTRATLRNTGGFEAPVWPRVPAADGADAGTLQVGSFGGFHTGGAIFTFADGSVRFISANIEPSLLRKFGHRADGELLTEEQ